MRRFDPDIIAALAEGRLDPEEAARFEREIAGDPAASHELELQRTALAALAESEAIQLSELERAGMRAHVADVLGLAPTGGEATAPPRRVPWGSLGVAAAALVGLVAVVPVVGLLNTASDDSADTPIAAEAPTSTAAATDTERTTGADELGESAAIVADGGSFDASQEAPGDDTSGFGSTTTLRSVATTQPAAETTTTAVEESTSTTLDPLAEFESLIADLTAIKSDPEVVGTLAATALEENLCWPEDTELRGEDPGERWTFEYFDGERNVVVYFVYDTEGLPGPFQVYDTPDCEELLELQ